MNHLRKKSLLLTVLCLNYAISGSLWALDTNGGPRENPELYPDYGGTPDLILAGDLRVSDQEIGQWLTQLGSEDLSVRQSGFEALSSNSRGAESLLRKALFGRFKTSNGAVKRVLARVYNNGTGRQIVDRLLAEGPKDDHWTATTQMAALLVLLAEQNTMAGYKSIIDFSHRYAGAFRSFIGRLLVDAGLDALPALVYARGSKNKERHMFAVKWIRDMENPLLSQQLQGIRNSRRLAQLLEAYASVNDLDAINVTLSCANHSSGFVRDAARRALAHYGANAKWAIFREYENNLDKTPDKSQDYRQWLKELLAFWDKARARKQEALFLAGRAAAKSGSWTLMDDNYRKILLDFPLTEYRPKMAADYLAYARALLAQEELTAGLAAVRMARRLSSKSDQTFAAATTILGEKQDEMTASTAQPVWLKVGVVSLLLFLASLLGYLRLRCPNRLFTAVPKSQ